MKRYKSCDKGILWIVLADYLPLLIGLFIGFLLWLLS